MLSGWTAATRAIKEAARLTKRNKLNPKMTNKSEQKEDVRDGIRKSETGKNLPSVMIKGGTAQRKEHKNKFPAAKSKSKSQNVEDAN